MKINFACGRQTWDGWYCIDAVQSKKATRQVDLLHAFRFDKDVLLNKLPIDDESADEIQSHHFIEHVYQWEAPAVISEFRRLLKPGGRLVLELPNIHCAAKNLLAGTEDQLSMWSFYGDPRDRDLYMCHRWGYTPATIESLLKNCGMRKIIFTKPQFHGKRTNRDMRVECLK
jgi:predicted SAM-dependent methyltransferase